MGQQSSMTEFELAVIERENDLQSGILWDDARQLIAEVRRGWAEAARLRAQVEGHCQRIAEQSELLSRRAEKGDADGRLTTGD